MSGVLSRLRGWTVATAVSDEAVVSREVQGAAPLV